MVSRFAPQNERHPSILLVLRVQEMAEAYPTVKFVSVDHKPLTEFPLYPRIDFEVYKFTTGFICPDASFDFVQAGLCVTLVSGLGSEHLLQSQLSTSSGVLRWEWNPS